MASLDRANGLSGFPQISMDFAALQGGGVSINGFYGLRLLGKAATVCNGSPVPTLLRYTSERPFRNRKLSRDEVTDVSVKGMALRKSPGDHKMPSGIAISRTVSCRQVAINGNSPARVGYARFGKLYMLVAASKLRRATDSARLPLNASRKNRSIRGLFFTGLPSK